MVCCRRWRRGEWRVRRSSPHSSVVSASSPRVPREWWSAECPSVSDRVCECTMDWRVALVVVATLAARTALSAWQDVVRPKMFVQIGEWKPRAREEVNSIVVVVWFVYCSTPTMKVVRVTSLSCCSTNVFYLHQKKVPGEKVNFELIRVWIIKNIYSIW